LKSEKYASIAAGETAFGGGRGRTHGSDDRDVVMEVGRDR
jgi:hypothetical protein